VTDQSHKWSPDQIGAHELLCELRTRVATQPLPYQHGVEARALESLWEIFALARKAMKDHPGCKEFARITTRMLNVHLRPVTAKWHRAHQAGVLDSRDGANDFRADLARLQAELTSFCRDLQQMAYGSSEPDDPTPPVLEAEEIARCFEPVRFGLATDVSNVNEINRDEAAEIEARRQAHQISTTSGYDAVGLALSGGGIRSATFCLGVVQVLAQRDLMKDVDYLSTVSGGGYTGAFITSWVGSAAGFEQVGNPFGPDTSAIRHLRRNAKYLSATDWMQRWRMVTSTLAGLLLNWTAPFAALAVLALIGDFIALFVAPKAWLDVSATLGILTAVAMLAYGTALRRDKAIEVAGKILAWGTIISVAVLAGAAIERCYQLFSDWQSSRWVLPAAVSLPIVAPAAVRFLPLFNTPARRKVALRIALIMAGAIVPIESMLVYYELRILASHGILGLGILVVGAALTGAFAFFGLDINLTGPHRLYRDKLAHTFVQHSTGDLVPALSDLNGSRRAPYHLINAVINLPSSTSDVLRDRRGDFFLFSKLWSGSTVIGYEPTTLWVANGKPIDLATAIAISGAAASPQMGLGSVPALSALMTLMNIRLGFWITKPGYRTSGHPNFRCLMREMAGAKMSEAQAWLNLSDGGHIENMGIYELLRRRCKFIVCVDGEADPASTFQGQLTLVRHAQIDLGIRIEPRFDDIRPDPSSRFSRSHLQLFRVHYAPERDSPGAVGLMLYMKLSLTGNEAELLKRYQALHPDFPHQSTLDQFYDEEQFEAYRQLGVHVADGAFAPALIDAGGNPQTVANWFRRLAANMLEPATELA
jgi:hypothetical protein